MNNIHWISSNIWYSSIKLKYWKKNIHLEHLRLTQTHRVGQQAGKYLNLLHFLACLYDCTRRATAVAQELVSALEKRLKFLCDGQGALRGAILYRDRL